MKHFNLLDSGLSSPSNGILAAYALSAKTFALA
jgi:hypothetical protein